VNISGRASTHEGTLKHRKVETNPSSDRTSTARAGEQQDINRPAPPV
jgi:hypothetical protein